MINLSLVGPPNQALERMVGALQQRGHLLVAAVGNDGPAAPPLYPASYPGVVGVSAVDRNGKPLPEAARGPQVMFAAPGNNMVSAAIGMPAYRAVRGTSFAAPLVAALLAGSLQHPDKVKAPAADRRARQAGRQGRWRHRQQHHRLRHRRRIVPHRPGQRPLILAICYNESATKELPQRRRPNRIRSREWYVLKSAASRNHHGGADKPSLGLAPRPRSRNPTYCFLSRNSLICAAN